VNGPAPSHRYPDELGIHGHSPWGDFILGYPNTFNNGTVYSPALAATSLGANGSFGAFRILKQDVAAFFDYLRKAAASVNFTPEQIAARLLGRWSNGVPLALSPDSDSPIPEHRLNMFLYKGIADGQASPDPFGTACPIGAHSRRGNPRDEIVQGGFTQQARIIRRNLPYGKEFDFPAIARFQLTESACPGGDTENFANDMFVPSEATADVAMPGTSHCRHCGLFAQQMPLLG
jgi:deferrochelatase/peroxidase EfeB